MKNNRLFGTFCVLCFASIVQLVGSVSAAEITRSWRYDYNPTTNRHAWVAVREADYRDGCLSIASYKPCEMMFSGTGGVYLELGDTGGKKITITSFENTSNPKVIFESNPQDRTLNLFWQPKAGVRYRVKFSETGWGSTHKLYVHTRGRKLD